MKLEAKTRLAAKLDGRDTKKVQLTLEGTPEALKTMLNFLAAVQYNTGVGHSCVTAAFFDGDGADKIAVEGIPKENLEAGKAMATACSDQGDGLMAMVGSDTAVAYATTYHELDGKTVQVVHSTKVYPERTS